MPFFQAAQCIVRGSRYIRCVRERKRKDEGKQFIEEKKFGMCLPSKCLSSHEKEQNYRENQYKFIYLITFNDLREKIRTQR